LAPFLLAANHNSLRGPEATPKILEGHSFMIDENCVIYREGKGFCWCPSAAWNLSDEELCPLCQVKNADIVEKIKIVSVSKAKVLSAQKS